jgi:tRNA(Ile)-lysidine synthase
MLVVAVSGGADSLALLHLLWALQAQLNFQIHVATFDHGWRGEQSAADAAYVAALAQQWGLAVTVGQNPTPIQSSGLEAAARRARYSFLAAVAQQVGASTVAVAHHADDQAETVLMRLIRGTGLHGLGGMRQIAPLPGNTHLRLIRPLLRVSRAEVEAYCTTHGIIPRHDPTNDDTDYLRNKLRHDTLPLLRQFNSNINTALATLAETAAAEDDYLQAQTEGFILAQVSVQVERVAIPRGSFRALHLALQRRVLRALVAQLVVGEAELPFERVEAARVASHHGQVGSRIEFPGGVWLRLDYDRLWIERASAPPPIALDPTVGEIVLELGVPMNLQGGTLLLTQQPTTDSVPVPISVGAQVTLRPRRAGDQLQPLGMGGHHVKLKEWLIDHKVPQSWRDWLPLVCVDGKIVAVILPGRVALTERPPHERTLYLQITATPIKP